MATNNSKHNPVKQPQMPACVPKVVEGRAGGGDWWKEGREPNAWRVVFQITRICKKDGGGEGKKKKNLPGQWTKHVFQAALTLLIPLLRFLLLILPGLPSSPSRPPFRVYPPLPSSFSLQSLLHHYIPASGTDRPPPHLSPHSPIFWDALSTQNSPLSTLSYPLQNKKERSKDEERKEVRVMRRHTDNSK